MGTPASQILSDFKGDHLSVHMADAVGDVRCISDAAMTAASNVISSPSKGFKGTDVGKLVKVYGAGTGQFSPNLYGFIGSIGSGGGTATIVTSAGISHPAVRSVSGAKCLVGTDYTVQFQALLDQANSLYIPFGAYAITGLSVLPGQRIYGQNKGGASGLFNPGTTGVGTAGAALGSCVVNFSDSDYAFEYLSDSTPGQIQDGFLFERFTLISKYGIRLNDPTVAGASQSYIHPAMVRDCLFQGDYVFTEDPEAFTSTLPTATGSANSMDQYGVGIAGRKLLRMEIKDCTFYEYGMSVWMCDWSQSSVRHSRLVHCGLFIWSSISGVDANWNKIIDNEIIEFARVGAIYIQYCNGLLIQGNWFEQNSAVDLTWLAHGNPVYIYSLDDSDLSIVDNDFLDNYSLTAPLYRLSPTQPAIVTGNHYLSSGLTAATATIDVSHYVNTTRQVLAKCYGNDQDFPIPDYPTSIKTEAPDTYLMKYNNYDRIFGLVTATFPWEISSTTGLWVIKSATLGFIWLPYIQSPAHRNFRLAISARAVSGTTFVSIYYYKLVGTVTGCTAANPVVITISPNAAALATNDYVLIEGILVNGFSGTPANGQHQITIIGGTTFSLNGVNGTGSDAYSQGGKIYLRTFYATYNIGLTDTTWPETKYVEFGLLQDVHTDGFWGIDCTNDTCEIDSIQLFPYEDIFTLKGYDQQTENLLNLRTYADVDKLTVGIDGRMSLPTLYDGYLFKTANYSVLKTDKTVTGDTTSGTVTFTLPTIASTFDAVRGLGQRYIFKWLAGSNPLILDGNGAELIEGAATFTFGSLGDAIVLQNNGVSWSIVAQYLPSASTWNTSGFTIGPVKWNGTRSITAKIDGSSSDDFAAGVAAGLVASTGTTGVLTAGTAAMIETLLGLSAAEVGYLVGISSGVQAQLNGLASQIASLQVDVLNLQNNKADHGTYAVVAGNVTI